MTEKIVLSLGSNVGDRKNNIVQAVELMKKKGFDPKAVSSLYETEPVGYSDQDMFNNIAVSGSFTGEPEQLLDLIKEVETDMGREKTFKNGPRNIDIDIILFGERKVCKKRLNIPHRSFKKRRFVLEPLNEIGKDIYDPDTGKKISRLIFECEDTSYIKKLGKISI